MAVWLRHRFGIALCPLDEEYDCQTVEKGRQELVESELNHEDADDQEDEQSGGLRADNHRIDKDEEQQEQPDDAEVG